MPVFARTLHNLELYDEQEVAPGLFSARDRLGGLRLHDGRMYRGYVNTWGTGKDGKPRFQAACWAGELEARREFVRRTYRTLAGAERAMLSNAIGLHNRRIR